MSKYRSEDELERWALMFKALANPHRLRIFLQLAGCSCMQAEGGLQGCMCVGDACQPVELAQSTLSHHLKELKHAGLIVTERDGRHIMCRLSPAAVQDIRMAAGALCPPECC